jgi:hypothetical protein
MGDTPKIWRGELSRRSMLRNLALTAGGAGMLGATLSGNSAAAAQTELAERVIGDQTTPKGARHGDAENHEAAAKMTQKAVGYQDTPKDAQRCDNCGQFELPASCKIVEGNIAPAGWCHVYVKKPA